jgi:pheromone shutdown protein TraB
MIKVYGTSHVSHESLDLIKDKINEHDPDTVALELDLMRLNALLNDDTQRGGPIFIRIIKKFQDLIGSRTGVMPGGEMLYAYNTAVNEDRDVALIDQEITDTIQKIKGVRRVEKARAVAQLVLGALIPGSFDISEIPEDEFIDKLLEQFKFKFPELHYVLVEERNKHMIEALKKLQEENPEQDIVAFVGAAHQKEIQEELDGYKFKAENKETDEDEETVQGLQRFE